MIIILKWLLGVQLGKVLLGKKKLMNGFCNNLTAEV